MKTLKCIIGSVIAGHMVQILFLKLKKKYEKKVYNYMTNHGSFMKS